MTRWLWMLGLMVAVAACGGTVTTTGGGDGGHGGHAGSGGSGGAGGGSGGAGGSGGCSSKDDCESGLCVFGVDSCDESVKGSCQGGFSCDGPPSGPVCQCDGTVLEGEMPECTILANSQRRAPAEHCATGVFQCGEPLACKRNVEVCVIDWSGFDPSWQCVPVSAIQGYCSNGIADCSCLDATALGCPEGTECCSADADHQETITIPSQ